MQFLQRFSKRSVNGFGFLVCAALMAYAYYSQFVQGYEPCPLCIFQRVAMIALGVVFALAALHNPGVVGSRIYAVLLDLVAMTGAAIAGWHVWLQNLPPGEAPECGPGLDYMLDAFPLTETLRMVFTASGECAEITWTLFGISMPVYVLLSFIFLGAMGLLRNMLPK